MNRKEKMDLYVQQPQETEESVYKEFMNLQDILNGTYKERVIDPAWKILNAIKAKELLESVRQELFPQGIIEAEQRKTEWNASYHQSEDLVYYWANINGISDNEDNPKFDVAYVMTQPLNNAQWRPYFLSIGVSLSPKLYLDPNVGFNTFESTVNHSDSLIYINSLNDNNCYWKHLNPIVINNTSNSAQIRQQVIDQISTNLVFDKKRVRY